MLKVLMLHGPNLNRLGRRDPEHYGTVTLEALEGMVEEWARERAVLLRAFQSNHEGTLIDTLQENADWADGALVNLGALTHTSYALHDALIDFGKPVVEVHLSAISQREAWRRVSLIRPVCLGYVEGMGVAGYRTALELLLTRIGEMRGLG